jgi:hypothetical protein
MVESFHTPKGTDAGREISTYVTIVVLVKPSTSLSLTSIHNLITLSTILAIDCLTAHAYNRGMNTLTHEKRCAVIRCLVDGCSIRATTRMTGVAKNTIQKLTRELGEAVLHNTTITWSAISSPHQAGKV